METLELPHIDDEPSKQYGSCLFLTTSLLTALSDLLPPKPSLTLSIGSGIALLEAMLSSTGRHLIECVEVNGLQSQKKYIKESQMHCVPGTWSTHSRATEAAAWLFVFPRDPQLLVKYFKECRHVGLKAIVWVGPIGDGEAHNSALTPVVGQPGVRCLQDVLHCSEAALIWRLEHEVNLETDRELLTTPDQEHLTMSDQDLDAL